MAVRYSGSEIVDIAKQIEAAGEAFYDAAAESVADPEVRELFQKLRDDERRHAAKFEKLLGQVSEEEYAWRDDEDYLAYMRALGESRVFPTPQAAKSALSNISSTEGALRCALGFEKDTILFLLELKEVARPESRAIVEQLLAEERHHVRMLSARLGELGGQS